MQKRSLEKENFIKKNPAEKASERLRILPFVLPKNFI